MYLFKLLDSLVKLFDKIHFLNIKMTLQIENLKNGKSHLIYNHFKYRESY